MVLFQHIVVDTGTVVEAVGIGDGRELAQRLIPFLVLGQQGSISLLLTAPLKCEENEQKGNHETYFDEQQALILETGFF